MMFIFNKVLVLTNKLNQENVLSDVNMDKVVIQSNNCCLSTTSLNLPTITRQTIGASDTCYTV